MAHTSRRSPSRTRAHSRARWRNDLTDYTPSTRRGRHLGPCDLCGQPVHARFSDHSTGRIRHRDCAVTR